MSVVKIGAGVFHGKTEPRNHGPHRLGEPVRYVQAPQADRVGGNSGKLRAISSAPAVSAEFRGTLEYVITRGIREFMARDWEALRELKDRHWADRIQRLGAAEGLRINLYPQIEGAD